jgi:uncharacterized SAM-binding protein YcdF (DUF218 family)
MEQSHLQPPESEQLSVTPDLLIVLGKNIGVRSSPEDIRNHPDHLSNESRMSVVAAGLLYEPGIQLLFSGGHTAGEDVPTEAEAMRDFLFTHFPDIPEEAVLLENNSIDTASNAEEVISMLTRPGSKHYQHINLLTVGYHLPGAQKIFDNFGVPIEQGVASETVISKLSADQEAFVEQWSHSRKVKLEKAKEAFRGLLLTVDPDGKMLRQITQKSRR